MPRFSRFLYPDVDVELESIKYADISLKEMLEKGSYGVVMKAEWNLGLFGFWKKAVAIKIIRTENAISVNREVRLND